MFTTCINTKTKQKFKWKEREWGWGGGEHQGERKQVRERHTETQRERERQRKRERERESPEEKVQKRAQKHAATSAYASATRHWPSWPGSACCWRRREARGQPSGTGCSPAPTHPPSHRTADSAQFLGCNTVTQPLWRWHPGHAVKRYSIYLHRFETVQATIWRSATSHGTQCSGQSSVKKKQLYAQSLALWRIFHCTTCEHDTQFQINDLVSFLFCKNAAVHIHTKHFSSEHFLKQYPENTKCELIQNGLWSKPPVHIFDRAQPHMKETNANDSTMIPYFIPRSGNR